MARKSTRLLVTLRSSAGTGMTYATTKNPRNTPGRLTLRKYDPKVRRVTEFREHR
ncbi:MAG TPA: 50S ribosomal protein L33 [Trebonia sp.]|jgi:large subunit ribosomal protein L33|nr:50S ribosomal protein L33 [Trebonia sp.]